VTAVHHETARDGAGAGQGGRDDRVGPAPAAQQQAARSGAHRAAEEGAAADDLTAQMHDPLLVLLGERALPALVT
jgi:hypothetical protein